MERRVLGSALEVSAIGYGAMGLIGLYGAVDEGAAQAVVRHAVEEGITFIDTADAYGAEGLGEELVGRGISGVRDQVELATKWGIAAGDSPTAHKRPDTKWDNEVWVDARPERAVPSLEASLRRLGVDHVDLWYLHWSDPEVPVEESVGAMAEAVAQGKAAHLGVCNVSADELRRAHAAHPVAAVQSEWSLWSRGVESEVVPTARELGVSVVPWAPLGSGFLTGAVRGVEPGDFRTNHPRFSADNLQANTDRFAPLFELASQKGVTPAQLALAWLLHRADDVVPIPGTRNPARLSENAAAVHVELSSEDLEVIDRVAPPGAAVGSALL